jgi:glycosyltransferase involved in cell wall biosynthesis
MKVALVYDRVNKWGGAERVLLALHKIFPDASLYTSVYSPKNAEWAKVFDVKTSFLQESPLAQVSHEYLASVMPLAFESFNFDGYDLVISVTSEAAKGVITKPNVFHLCYCLTPTRYLWSGYDEYFKNDVFRFLSKPVVSRLRKWDKVAAQRPDRILAISTEVKKRIKKYYQRDARVLFPPLTLSSKKNKTSPGKYFLVVSRLTNFYKRIDIAIEACSQLNLPLKIVGTGRDKAWLESIAGKKVEFLGELSEIELSKYYANCRALIFPGREDFGLSMVEALSFGKPIIAFRGGGALDIVKERLTGDFFNKQTPESLIGVLENFRYNSYNTKLCMESAKQFSFDNFKKGLLREISKI